MTVYQLVSLSLLIIFGLWGLIKVLHFFIMRKGSVHLIGVTFLSLIIINFIISMVGIK